MKSNRNTAMQEPIVESHPFAALLPPQATVMMMGTFPPKEEKHAMQFHYPNFKAIREHGNASDKFLKVIETVDLATVLAQMPECRHLCTTGGKATEVLLEIQGSGMKMPKTGETVPFPYAGRELTLTRLPSTSRAYPLSLAKKAAAYRAFFETAGLTVFQE